MLAPRVRPPDLLPWNTGARLIGDVNQIWKFAIDAISLRLDVHRMTVIPHHVNKRPLVHSTAVRLILIAKTVTRKRNRPAGMLLFHIAVQIGGKADLSLHFLLAVPVIIIGQQCDDHACFRTAGEFERRTIVVFFFG